MRARLRLALLLQAVAVGVTAAGLLVLVGLPLAVRGALVPRTFIAVASLCALVVGVATAGLLLRWVGGPLERLLAAAARAGEGGALPPLGPRGDEGGPGLSRAAVAFERTAAALAEERATLRDKVEELERRNRQLATAREDLLRAERLAAVGRLAAGVAHEVGNPLGAITAYAELARAKLAAGGAAPDVVDFLCRIATETQRIDLIVRDLLDFARPARLELGPVRVEVALEAALRIFQVQARSAQVRVSAALPRDLPSVHADVRRLSQVFLNLLLNAADAMGAAGEVRVTAAADAARVELQVSDQGPGVPPEMLPRLFEPFVTTKAPGAGTGLGLAVCHGILESFGGAIWAENGARGAVFRLSLPRA